jgi:hypothetical protein
VKVFNFGRLINFLKVSRRLMLERYNLVLETQSTAAFKKVDPDRGLAGIGG